MSYLETLWVEKYRPKNLEGYIFQDDKHYASFKQMVENKSIPHLLLSGMQGSGKTTIAYILMSECDIDETDRLIINASDENSVDTIRDKIKSFISTYAMSNFKVILLDEADYITANGQAILRKLMEEYADSARFILTCNYENKIIPAIKSRCHHFRFKSANKDIITEHVATILIKEKVKFDIRTLDKIVSIGYPDIRKIINLLQQYTHENVLQPPIAQGEVGDYKFELIDLIQLDKWNKIRKIVCENVSGEEWEDLYRFLYENLHRAPKFENPQRYEEGILIIAEHLYKHSLCADPEINAAAMFIRLGQL